jgi:predicted TPR repeat methyltransferase
MTAEAAQTAPAPAKNVAADVGRQIGLARNAQNNGDAAATQSHAQAALDFLKDVPLNYENLDWRQLAEGDAQWLLGNLAGAEKAFRQAMVAAPQQSGGYQRLYELLSQSGRTEDAKKHLDLCTKKFPKDGFFLKQTAVQAAANQNYDIAIPALANAFAANNDDHEAADALGCCLQNINHFNEAVLYHARALELQPANAAYAVRFGLAIARTDGGLIAAADLFRHAISLNPYFFDAYAQLGYTLQKLGKDDEARIVYEDGLARAPDHAELNYNYGRFLQATDKLKEAAEHYGSAAKTDAAIAPAAEYLHASLTGEQPPETAPAEFIQSMFDFYAPHFDVSLLDKLGYRSPGVLQNLLLSPAVSHIKDIKTNPQRILDLGCGTGLMGAAIKPYASELVGVDLSPNMLMRAAEKNIYTATRRQDITEFLTDMPPQAFDVVVAADVFIYIGKLDEIFNQLGQKLAAGSLFAFAVEHLPDTAREAAYTLLTTARYAHKDSYIRGLAGKNGFTVAAFDQSAIRTHKEKPVEGLYYVLAKN